MDTAPLTSTASVPLNAAAIFAILASSLSVLWYIPLIVLVLMRKERQPLKLKSPLLLVIFLLGNITTIILMTLIYVDAEYYN